MTRGRPKGIAKPETSGIQKGYKYKKVSDKQVAQRKDAGIQSGKYKLMEKELGRCRSCPIRDICTHREEGKVEVSPNSKYKVKGCNQAREIFEFHLAGLTTNEKYLVTDIAHLQTKLDMQEMKDGMEKMIFSPEWIKAKELNMKQLKLLHELREKKGRNAIPITIDAEVIEFNKEDDEKKYLRNGDMYIPPPKPKEKIIEVKPNEPEQPSKGDNLEGERKEASEHSPSQGDNEDSVHETSVAT